MDDIELDRYKIVLVGDLGVGKTYITSQYLKKQPPKKSCPTVGVEFASKEVQLKDNTKIKAQIWDTQAYLMTYLFFTAGQERYRAITTTKALGALLVYDITKESTFKSLIKWIEDLRSKENSDLVIVLIGNKQDLVIENPENRQISEVEAQEFAKDNNLIFMETSSFLGTNINEAFQTLCENIYYQKQTVKFEAPEIGEIKSTDQSTES